MGRLLVVEDHGNVKVIGEPSEGVLRFLSALADGTLHTKEELLAVVWGIACYRPAAHDPVIHTAVSRLRARLGILGHWVEAAPGGYRLARGVEVVNPFEAAPPSSGQLPAPKAGGVLSRASLSPAGRTPDTVLAVLAQNGASSSRDVASQLGVSEMTALRRLREQVEKGAIRRDGKGKNTRYRLLRSLS
jgi:DNA-binding winged helix-turn-helix (wHTH) protein